MATRVEMGERNSDRIEASRARQAFRELIDAAANRGVRATITRNGRPMAAVVPLRDLERLQEADLALDARLIEGEDAPVDPNDAIPIDDLHAESAQEVQTEPADALDLPFRVVVRNIFRRRVTANVVDAAAHLSALRLVDICRTPSAGKIEIAELEDEIRRSLTEAIEKQGQSNSVAESLLSGLLKT